MKKVSHTTRTIVVLSIAILLVVGVYAVLRNRITANKTAIADTYNEISIQAGRHDRMARLITMLEQLRDEQSTLATYFVSAPDVVEIIKNLESLARGAGVTLEITSVNVSDPTDDMPDSVLLLGIALEGSWTEVTQMIALLETYPVQSMVGEVSLRQQGSVVGEQSRWRADTTFRAVLKQ